MSKPVESPCINFCQLDPQGQFCEGCFRKIEEIANWQQYDDRMRQAILDELPRRCHRFETGKNENES